MKFNIQEVEKKAHNHITIMLKMVGIQCNMQCHYCYENQYQYTGINNECMTVEEIIKALQIFSNFNYIKIVFHGGEPLLAPINDVKLVLNNLKTLFPNKYEIQFQTNGTLINEEWINLFLEIKIKLIVSVSLDPKGKKDLRQSDNNIGYRKKVFRNIQELSKNNINVGVISVAHKYNLYDFNKFIVKVIEYGAKFLTINKYRYRTETDDLFISEKKYNNQLKKIFAFWVNNKLYSQIQIQPFMSLLSDNPNKSCLFLADKKKCTYFRTIYKNKTYYCEHFKCLPLIQNRECDYCDIYDWCGGGCLAEMKDTTFCSSRKDFKKFIEMVKYENKQSV